MRARLGSKTIAGMQWFATIDHETRLNFSANTFELFNERRDALEHISFLVRYCGLSGLIFGRIEFNSVPFSLAYSRLIDVAM